MEDCLPRVTAPALIMQGEADRYGTPRQVEAIARGLAGPHRTLLLPGVGHAPHLEAPDAVVEAVASFVSASLAAGRGLMRVVVMGAGVIGIAAAYEVLARRPRRDGGRPSVPEAGERNVLRQCRDGGAGPCLCLVVAQGREDTGCVRCGGTISRCGSAFRPIRGSGNGCWKFWRQCTRESRRLQHPPQGGLVP